MATLPKKDSGHINCLSSFGEDCRSRHKLRHKCCGDFKFFIAFFLGARILGGWRNSYPTESVVYCWNGSLRRILQQLVDKLQNLKQNMRYQNDNR